MSSLLDRDPFTSYLRSLEAKLPSLVKAVRALRERDLEALYVNAVSGTIFEAIVERGLEEGWGLERVEDEFWKEVSRIFSELRECSPSEYAFLVEAFEALLDLENLARVVARLPTPEGLIPIGRLSECLARGGTSVEKCLEESALAKFVSLEMLTRALGSVEDLLYAYTYSRLAIAKTVLERLEGMGLEPAAIECVRNALAREVAHVASLCSLATCPESVAKAVRDAIGIDMGRAIDIVRTRSGEELVESIEKAREARDSSEELDAVVRNVVHPLASVGEGADLLYAVLQIVRLGMRLAMAAYGYRRGVAHV